MFNRRRQHFEHACMETFEQLQIIVHLLRLCERAAVHGQILPGGQSDQRIVGETRTS